LSISEPKTSTKEGAKKISCPTFFEGTNITKLTIILFLTWKRKKIEPIYKELYFIVPFNQKIVIKLSKILVWSPGSEIRDPGSKRHRIPDPDLQHWMWEEGGR
jgi:hypothetical protein